MKKLLLVLVTFVLSLGIIATTEPVYATDTAQYLPGGKNYLDINNFNITTNSMVNDDPIAIKPSTTYTLQLSDEVYVNYANLTIYGFGRGDFYIEDEDPFIYDGANYRYYYTFTTDADEYAINLYLATNYIGYYTDAEGFGGIQLEEGSSATAVETYVEPTPDSTPPVFSGSGTWYSNVENPDTVATIKASISATDETDGNVTAGISVIYDTFTANNTTVGNYDVWFEVSDAAGNTSTFEVEVRVVDIDLPVINLTGSSTVYVEVGNSYAEPGATVSDNYYTGLSATITGSVNTNVLGTYYRYYNVTDPSGNVAVQKIRTVVVRDTTAPVITLSGSSTIYVEYGSTYSELGASASDNYDSSVTVNLSGSVNNNVLGSYTITYTAVDSSGNNALTKTRTVIVRDTTAPIISLNGSSTVYVEFGDTYTEQGASWTDTYDGSGSATASGTVNVGVLGSYTVTYSKTDSNGNVASAVTRTVIVQDTTAPFLQTNITNIDTYNSLSETFADVVAGIVVLDTHDGDVTVDISYTTNEYATANNIVGVYDVTLQVSDSSGNTFTHNFTITINDDVEPVFSFTGYLLDTATADAMTQDQIRDHINNRS